MGNTRLKYVCPHTLVCIHSGSIVIRTVQIQAFKNFHKQGVSRSFSTTKGEDEVEVCGVGEGGRLEGWCPFAAAWKRAVISTCAYINTYVCVY
jgi:hypothetical protein